MTQDNLCTHEKSRYDKELHLVCVDCGANITDTSHVVAKTTLPTILIYVLWAVVVFGVLGYSFGWIAGHN